MIADAGPAHSADAGPAHSADAGPAHSADAGPAHSADAGPARSATAGGPAAVRVTGLRKRYGDVVALADVDLRADQGEFFTLLGPSGAWKTTLLGLIPGFARPAPGRTELCA